MTVAPRVLVIDDDADARDLYTAVLGAAGYTVETASDGADAIQRLCEPGESPDLILLDLLMPGMDGVEFRKVQQRYLRLASIPVVVLSGVASPEQTVTLGAAAVLIKPVAPTDLLAVVEQLCGPARASMV